MKVQYKLSCAKSTTSNGIIMTRIQTTKRKACKYRSFSCTTNHGKAKRQQ